MGCNCRKAKKIHDRLVPNNNDNSRTSHFNNAMVRFAKKLARFISILMVVCLVIVLLPFAIVYGVYSYMRYDAIRIPSFSKLKDREDE